MRAQRAARFSSHLDRSAQPVGISGYLRGSSGMIASRIRFIMLGRGMQWLVIVDAWGPGRPARDA